MSLWCSLYCSLRLFESILTILIIFVIGFNLNTNQFEDTHGNFANDEDRWRIIPAASSYRFIDEDFSHLMELLSVPDSNNTVVTDAEESFKAKSEMYVKNTSRISHLRK